jgi:hypothetical protein
MELHYLDTHLGGEDLSAIGRRSGRATARNQQEWGRSSDGRRTKAIPQPAIGDGSDELIGVGRGRRAIPSVPSTATRQSHRESGPIGSNRLAYPTGRIDPINDYKTTCVEKSWQIGKSGLSRKKNSVHQAVVALVRYRLLLVNDRDLLALSTPPICRFGRLRRRKSFYGNS